MPKVEAKAEQPPLEDVLKAHDISVAELLMIKAVVSAGGVDVDAIRALPERDRGYRDQIILTVAPYLGDVVVNNHEIRDRPLLQVVK